MPALLLSMYIRNTTKRTEFVLCGQKNHGCYTKTRGKIEQNKVKQVDRAFRGSNPRLLQSRTN